MGNNLQKKRQIKVSNIGRRLSKQDRQNLKDAFDRIQDRQIINDYQFRLEVLGPQVPETIAIKLMQLFSSENQIPEVMNFEDLLACYIVFKQGRPEEMGQLCFEIMKMTTGSEYLSREHITLFTEKLVNLNEQIIQTFYAKTEFDPRLPIKKEEFVSAFKKVSNLPLFTWVTELLNGYDQESMNMDDVNTKSTDLSKKLTMLSNERARNETENLGFNPTEHDNMQEFFNKELKKNDAKEVLRTIQLLFKDIRSSKLKRYFVEALTKHKILDFTFLTTLVFVVCKESDEKKKLEFLFELFAMPASDSIKRKSMRDFAEIFKLGQNFFQARGNSITKQEFTDDCVGLNIDFSVYEKSKYAMIAMMGLMPINEEEEREAILSALGNNHSIEGYIQEHLEEEETFYVIEKQFFEAWSMNVGFVDDKSYIIKKEKMTVIDNEGLLEPMHSMRLKDVPYGEGFILVPKFVFYPLSKWYKCTKTIERQVINYRSEKKKALAVFKQRKMSNAGGPSASMIVAGTQPVPDHFFKSIGDVTFELEVYPKFFYYEKINDKGERPHQKAIVNQKIDMNYVKKVLKQDKLPFQEMLISRKKTFEEVLREISAVFKENYKRGRLWIEDQVISGAKLEMNLDEFGISMGQVVYVEYANNNNQWPTDKQGAGPASGQTPNTTPAAVQKSNENLRTNGLYNLGNTCYMNSALQCLANTKFFHEYFIKEKRYLKQMNLKNKLGHQGELLQRMYQTNKVVIPREFKQAIATISEQFQGYDQQDSQEFLSFILDGLHEELNLRQEKPYLENPDSDNRKIVELGLESWSNTLRREWSFIFWLFYGQLKSTLNCQVCNKISTTFDIFTNIPLSLPEPSKILLNVIIYRLPNEIKDMINSHANPGQAFRRIDSTRSDDLNKQHNSAHASGAPASNIFKIQESFKYVTNDQPIHIALRVEKDIKISQLMYQICEIKDVNIDFGSKCSNLVLFSQTKGPIRGIFNPENRLTNYNLLNNEIEAIEVLNSRGRDQIREFYRQNEQIIDLLKTPHLTCLLQQSEKFDESITSNTTKPQTQSSASNSRKKSTGKQSNKTDTAHQSQQQKQKIDKCTLFNSYQVAYDRYQDFEDNGNFPDEIYAVGYHRRFVKKTYYFFNPYQPTLLSSPLIFILPLKPTGRRVYEEVWAVAQNILKKSSKFHNKQNLWWEAKNWQDKLVKKEGEVQQFKPFVLKTVDRSGFSCSSCSWIEMCSGCILPPTEEFIEDFFKKCHLAIEWHSSLIEDEYNPSANEVIHHASTQDKEIIEEDQVNLEDCMRKFHEVEEISGQQDHIYCSNCKKPQGHLKKLEIFRPPPMLIVQLKRFKYSNVSRNKLNTFVEFPLYNLDLSTFVTDQDFLNQMGIDQKYDLYGMINHYGNLSFGHYISIIKNFQDNKWYKYDDSSRSPINEDQIQKDFAYILFYIRKDVLAKTNIDELIPSIKDFFPGKPIQTENGNCFILGQEDTNKFKIQYEKGKDTQIIQSDLIIEEKDSNEFHFDAKDMIEIQSQKKERLQEQKRKLLLTQQKKRKCRMCVSFSFFGGGSPVDSSGLGIQSDLKKGQFRSKKRSIKQSIARNSGMSGCQIF